LNEFFFRYADALLAAAHRSHLPQLSKAVKSQANRLEPQLSLTLGGDRNRSDATLFLGHSNR
jgi:hypothetical protein